MKSCKMKRRMGSILAAVMVFFLCSAAIPVMAKGPNAIQYGVVLNLSGKQRMLSQKMSKEVMLIALGHDTAGNVKNLQATTTLFDRTLKGLRDGDKELKLVPTSEQTILDQLKVVEGLWNEFYPVLKEILDKKSVSKEQVSSVASMNLPLLKEMNKTVGMYENDARKYGLSADPGVAVTINLSGRQRMLTQKMSKEFLLIAYGHEAEANKKNLSATSDLFEKTLTGLLEGDPEQKLPRTYLKSIRVQVEHVQELWASFKPLIDSAASGGAIAAAQIKEVADKNLPLLIEMNNAVGKYENLAAMINENFNEP